MARNAIKSSKNLERAIDLPVTFERATDPVRTIDLLRLTAMLQNRMNNLSLALLSLHENDTPEFAKNMKEDLDRLAEINDALYRLATGEEAPNDGE